MQTWVALLRAVNVGGFTLPMAELRALCERAGFSEVRTYIASGNLLLRDNGSEKAIKTKLEAVLHAHAGKPVGVVLRSGAELQAVIDANPFADAESNRVIVFFLDAAPATDALANVKNHAGERIALGTREIYVDYTATGGQGQSKLQIPAAKTGTGRNLNTVAKLAEMARK